MAKGKGRGKKATKKNTVSIPKKTTVKASEEENKIKAAEAQAAKEAEEIKKAKEAKEAEEEVAENEEGEQEAIAEEQKEEAETSSTEEEVSEENDQGNEEGSPEEQEESDAAASESAPKLEDEEEDITEEKPKETAAPVESDFIEYIKTSDNALNQQVNALLNTYSRHMPKNVTIPLNDSVTAIRVLDKTMKIILNAENDRSFTEGWKQLERAIAEEKGSLGPHSLTRGAHNNEGVPSITQSSFQLLVILGMAEGSEINLDRVLEGVDKLSKERLIAYYAK